MDKHAASVLLVVVMVAVIVAADVLLFRHLIWARLLANIGIVFICIALYLRFMPR